MSTGLASSDATSAVVATAAGALLERNRQRFRIFLISISTIKHSASVSNVMENGVVHRQIGGGWRPNRVALCVLDKSKLQLITERKAELGVFREITTWVRGGAW